MSPRAAAHPAAPIRIHPSAVVDRGAEIGGGTLIWHFSHVREHARIGFDCTIGQNVYIDRGVVIGDRCKIQNGVSIYDGVRLADEVFVGPNATFTNDKYPRAIGPWTPEATVIGYGASIGANATIVCGVVIGDYAMIGAGAVVCEDVEPYALMVGNPARKIGRVCAKGHRDCEDGHA